MSVSIMAEQNSTNGRSLKNGRSTVSPLFRTGFRLAAAAAPGLAARAAERLFITPPRQPAPAAERDALAGAERFEVNASGERLACFRLGDGPAVLLLHGWGGRSAQLAPIARALQARGCAAVLVDLPAHGGSTGRTASAIQFAAAAAAVADRVGARAAVGHSMGAAALALALQEGLRLDAAVLVGPPRTPGVFFARFAEALALPEDVRQGAHARLTRRFGIAPEDLDVVRAAPGLATPALVFHDRRDAEVPFGDGEAIAAAWPGAQLVATDGLGHRRILRKPEIAAAAAEFVLARIPRCACGALTSPEPGAAGRCAGCVLSSELWDVSARHPRGPLRPQASGFRPEFGGTRTSETRAHSNSS
jgi:pimeloyl-ACP methyl ester carboxylesterase